MPAGRKPQPITVDRILAKTRGSSAPAHVRKEDGPCLIWHGAMDKGVPKVRSFGRTISVRRWLYAEHHGLSMDAIGHVKSKCHDPRCVQPTHHRHTW